MTIKHPMLSTVRRTLIDAGRVARSVQPASRDEGGLIKGDRTPVTVADYAVQAIVSMELRAAEPGALIVGEERADELRPGGTHAGVVDAVVEAVRIARPDATKHDVLDAIDACNHEGTAGAFWALDPIDGTKGFLRGEQYAIALGRIEGGAVTFGAMGCPNLPDDPGRRIDEGSRTGSIYMAARGAGAWGHRGDDPDGPLTPIRAAAFDEGCDLRICESVEAAHSSQGDAERIVAALGRAKTPVRIDSQCKYAIVARGQADAYLRLPTSATYVEKIWDHAAGCLIATEAGATVTDITAAPLDFGHGRRLEANRGVVCAAAALHPNLIRVIESLGIGGTAMQRGSATR